VRHELSAEEARLTYPLFPHLGGLELDQVEDLGDLVRLVARTRTSPVTCPECGEPAPRVHDRYWRRLQDLSCCGRPVQVVLQVRRFICDNPACAVATFAEQVAGLTARYQRRTIGLRSLLERVALALAGRAGSRLARALGAIVSRCTLIRLIRALPDPEIGTVAVLGVDDWAKRRGQSYASVLPGHGHPSHHRHPPRPGGRHLRPVAPRSSWCPADLPGPGRRLRAGRPRGRARCPAGCRKVAHVG
jgi:zinc-finger of transposase IS204/IS1001/IS1096/IS1165